MNGLWHRRHVCEKYFEAIHIDPRRGLRLLVTVIAAGAIGMSRSAQGQVLPQRGTVRVTPIGSHTGELCVWDRALLFEDPTGVRLLYDPGITVFGADDPRLGAVDAILVSHNHNDHIGNAWLADDPNNPTASCESPPGVHTDTTVVAGIAAVKNSAVFVGHSAVPFFATRISALGQGMDRCYRVTLESTRETVVPRARPCVGPLEPGTKRIITRSAGSAGIQIATILAPHIDSFLTPRGLSIVPPLDGELAESGLTAYPGLALGFVLTFSNGLRVFLSGDTGPSSDMGTIVGGLYHPHLAVMNVDGVNSMAAEEAAFAVTELIKPQAVIPSHPQLAATSNGMLIPGTETAEFVGLVGNMPVYLPLSGRTMAFTGNGRCVAGCGP